MTTGNPFYSSQGWSSLQRPVYSPGLLLEDEDLNVGVSYTQGLVRLVLKSLFGCGVICGLDVTAEPTCKDTKRKITVNPGIALDGEGNLIEVTQPWSHEFGPHCDKGWPEKLWVVLCYREKCCRPKDVTCSADGDSQSKQTRVRAGFEINLWETLPKCTCRCKTDAEDDEQDDGDEEDCGCGGRKKVKAAAKASTERSTGEEPEEDEELCPCYADHFKGICGCDCCRCVVLAKIVKIDVPEIEVDSSMVRRVRPVLNGYLQCRFPEQDVKKQQSDSNGEVLGDTPGTAAKNTGARRKLQERSETKTPRKADKG